MHSLVAELWDEWASFSFEDEGANSSEISGLVSALPFKKNGAEGTVVLGTSRLWALRRLAKLWKNSRWRTSLNAASAMRIPADKKGRVELVLPQGLYEEVTTPGERGKWDWARGVWGGCGALYVPRSGYYLVMRVGPEPVVRRMERLLNRIAVSWSGRTQHGKNELILREQQGIVAFLSKIGLDGVSLSIEDKAILRAMRDQANRMRNCDTANINKTLKAAEAQMEVAQRLQREGLIPSLPAPFRALVETRLEHPEESLSDLGGRLSPPVTKSTVKYRWKRLCEFLETDSGRESGNKNEKNGKNGGESSGNY